MVLAAGALQVGASAVSRVTAHLRKRTCRCAPSPGVRAEVVTAGAARAASLEGTAPSAGSRATT
eukprot:8686589-Alexandrium_andersonii.AAC.1